MAKISTYPSDSNVSLNDMLIGSDANDSNNTKNYTIGSILSVAGSSTYVPYTGATANVDLGAFGLTSSAVINANTLSTSSFLSLNGSAATLLLNGSGGTSGQILVSNGVGVTPSWVNLSSLSSSQLKRGSFYDTITQLTIAATNTIIFRNTDTAITNGVSVVTNGTNLTRITFPTAGIYNISMNANLTTLSSAAGHSATFYLRKNGTGTSNVGNIANSSRYYAGLPNSQAQNACASWIVSVAANDYIELMCVNTSAAYQIQPIPASGDFTNTPSVSILINQIA